MTKFTENKLVVKRKFMVNGVAVEPLDPKVLKFNACNMTDKGAKMMVDSLRGECEKRLMSAVREIHHGCRNYTWARDEIHSTLSLLRAIDTIHELYGNGES